jgi:hypothetical protein
MKRLLVALVLVLNVIPFVDGAINLYDESRFMIAGIDERDLEALFLTLNTHLGEELGKQFVDLVKKEPIRLLNLFRDSETGFVQRVTFSQGDVFVSFHPLKNEANASLNLNPGFDYEVELKVSEGAAAIVRAGIVSVGAQPFEID